MHRRLLTFVLFGVLGISARANAATIIFDMCTVASLCGQVEYRNDLQLSDGNVVGSLTNQTTFGIRILDFGINLDPGVEFYSLHGPLAGPYTPLGAGSVGPYGNFTTRFLPPANNQFNLIFGLDDPNGPFASALAPFFENTQGVFFAAQVLDNKTGVTGFVAARLNDAAPVPEPGTLLLFGTGLAAVARRARRLS